MTDIAPLNRALTTILQTQRACRVDMAELRQVVLAWPTLTLAAGERLYAEGERSEGLHLLIEGSARVLAGKGRTLLCTLQAPAVLGHLGALTGLPRSATVEIASRATLLHLSGRDLALLLNGSGEGPRAFRRLLIAALGGLLGDTNRHLLDVVPEHGQPIPTNAPRVAPPPPAARARPRGQSADDLSRNFDADLLAELENIRIVQTEADRRDKYKR